MKPTFDEFSAIVNPLVDYYSELEQLKEGGLDLTKFAAHQALVRINTTNLIDKFGTSATLELLAFCNNKGIIAASGKDAEVMLPNEDYYKAFIDKFCKSPEVCPSVIREGKDVDDLVDDGKGCDFSRYVFDKLGNCVGTVDEKQNTQECVCKDPKKKSVKYKINGKEVSEEAYNKAMERMSAFKEIMSDSFADVFDQVFDKLFK